MIEYAESAHAAMLASDDAASLSSADWNGAVNDVHRALLALPIPHPAALLGVELPFSLPFTEEVMIKGKIDLALRTGARSLHIRDWKSGALPVGEEALETNTQLGVYMAAARHIFPWAHVVTVGLYSTSEQRELVRELDPSSVATLMTGLHRDIHDAFNAVDLLSPGVAESTVDCLFSPSPGEHCARCVYRSLCPVFADPDSPLPVRQGVDVAAERNRIRRLWSPPSS